MSKRPKELSNDDEEVSCLKKKWTCPNYRRSVAACLVMGAYDLEEAQKNSQDCEPKWEKFHFALEDNLVDDADSSIFGAIYKFNPPKFIQNSSSGDAPKIVVAFRGTVKENFEDFKLDFHVFINDLAGTPRFKRAMRAVEEMASAVGSRNLWLAGHSLGASIAMLAGKKMAMKGINIETFLFNPPYSLGSVEWIRSERVKRIIQMSNSILSAVVALAEEGRRVNSRDYFAKLSSWVPHLFVNSADLICSGYIGYFKHRENMKKIGAEGIGDLATRISLRVTLIGDQSEPMHLLPSANLWINSPGPNLAANPDHFHKIDQGSRDLNLLSLIEAHKMNQWTEDLNLHSLEYRYNVE